MTYNGFDLISFISGVTVGIIVYMSLDFVRAFFGWTPKIKPAATMISEQGRKDLDFVYEKTGFRAHKVGDQPFNGFIKYSSNPEAEKVEEILYRYSNNGYVFTDRAGRLFGRVCSIWTKADRVEARRSQIKLIVNNNTESITPGEEKE